MSGVQQTPRNTDYVGTFHCPADMAPRGCYSYMELSFYIYLDIILQILNSV